MAKGIYRVVLSTKAVKGIYIEEYTRHIGEFRLFVVVL